MSHGEGGGKGGGRGGYNILWDPPRPGHLLQLFRESSLGGGERLTSSGQQPSTSTVEVRADDRGTE